MSYDFNNHNNRKAGHKPGSVHLKRWAIIYLGLELLHSLERRLKVDCLTVINLLSLAPSRGLPSQHFSMLLVRSYHTLAPLPYNKVLGGMFLWHYPHGCPHWELPSKPDHMGARTFLKKVLFCFQNKTFSRLPLLLSFSIMLNTPKIIYWGCSSAG